MIHSITYLTSNMYMYVMTEDSILILMGSNCWNHRTCAHFQTMYSSSEGMRAMLPSQLMAMMMSED